MANRIEGNVLVIDSLMGVTVPIFDIGSGGLLNNISIAAVAFWSADTTGKFELVSAINSDTTVIALGPTVNAVNGSVDKMYLGGIPFGELRVKSLTVGTAWIYFK